MGKHNGKHEPSPSEGAAHAENKGVDYIGKTIDDIVKLETLEATVAERMAEQVAILRAACYLFRCTWLGLVFGLSQTLPALAFARSIRFHTLFSQ